MSSTPRPSRGMPTNRPVGPPPQMPPKKKRRWIFRLFWLMMLCAVIVGVFPYLASSVPAVRNFLLSRTVPNLNGSITAEGASLGWEKPIEFQGVTIRSAVGLPVVQVAELQGNRPLWKIPFKPSVLGDYRVERPQVNMVIYPNGSTSVSEVFTGTDPIAVEQPVHKKVPNFSVGVELIDGSLTVSDSLGQNAWVAEPVNFAFRLRPSSATSDGRAQLEIPAVKVFDHVRVTPQVCHDMLKYIAPVMADATRTDGTFSISLDKWSFPLDAPSEGSGKGVFTVHELSIGAGPIIQNILTSLGVGGQLVNINEAPVKFELADGRMRHEGLVFHVERIKFTTSGSVGMKDETLDLAIVVQMPTEIQAERPVLQALAGQSITIPVRGTLGKPEVDVHGLTQSGIQVLTNTLDRLLAPPEGAEDPADGTDATEVKPETQDDQSTTPAIDVDSILNRVEELRRRRQERLKENPDATPVRPLFNRLITPSEGP